MKQGRASRDVLEGWKRDPKPKGVDVDGVSQIGSAMGNHVTGSKRILSNVPKAMYGGPAFMSPLGSPGTPGVGRGGRVVHKSGSQGKR